MKKKARAKAKPKASKKTPAKRIAKAAKKAAKPAKKAKKAAKKVAKAVKTAAKPATKTAKSAPKQPATKAAKPAKAKAAAAKTGAAGEGGDDDFAEDAATNATPAEVAASRTEIEQSDLMIMDGMKVPSPAERAANVAESATDPKYAQVRAAILSLFRDVYPSPEHESDETVLATDPNDFDMDPSPFYEMLSARFGLEDDPDQDYFGGFGGKVEHTIAVVTKRWDGTLREVTGEY